MDDECRYGMAWDQNCHDLVGGLAAPTTWPVAEGQAIDLLFDRSDDKATGVFDRGIYRGIVDKAGAPSARGIQKLSVLFPDEYTKADVELTRQQLYKPGQQPKDPTVEDGEVAVEVPASELPAVVSDENAFGLSDSQLETLKRIWYENGHYSGVKKMWEVLRRQAEAQGAEAFFGIRRRQLRKWIQSQEAKQLMRVPENPKVFRPFGFPSEPLRTLQMDSLNLGDYGGQGGRQKWISVIVDPATRYVAATAHGTASGGAPKASVSIANLVTMLSDLRRGPLRYDAGNQGNVFDEDGALVHRLRLSTDSGSEFRIKGAGDFGDRLFEKLSATSPPLIRSRGMLSHSYNPPSQPTAAAFVERMNQTIRSKLRMAVQAEQGDIRRSNARDIREREGWKALLARAIAAINNEVAAGTSRTPNESMADYLRNGKQSHTVAGPKTRDEARRIKQRAALAEQKRLTPGTVVRLVNQSRQKSELVGKRKLEPRWSEELFRVSEVLKRGADTDSLSYDYRIERMNGAEKPGVWKREQLLVVPPLETKHHGRAVKGLWKQLSDAGTVPGVQRPTEEGGKWIPIRDGSSWAEKRISAIPKDRRGGLGYETLLGRLVQYLRSGQSKVQALKRLYDSLDTGAPVNDSRTLAILTRDS
jgi:hypothetical protein